MVRKADEQGAIEPDVKGRFAGHAVHYYDEARIPLSDRATLRARLLDDRDVGDSR